MLSIVAALALLTNTVAAAQSVRSADMPLDGVIYSRERSRYPSRSIAPRPESRVDGVSRGLDGKCSPDGALTPLAPVIG